MRALRLSKKKGLYLSDTNIPRLSSDEVLIQVKYVGICGSDIKIIRGEMGYLDDIILGHEFGGTIVAIGKGVMKWKKGDRVVADPTITCGKCTFCLSNQHNLCLNLDGKNGGELGVNLNGAFADYVKIKQENIYRLPSEVSFQEATLVEPLACILNGFNRLHIQEGASAGIIGLGPIGLLWSELFRLGKVSVCGTDLSDTRTKIANSLGVKKLNPSYQDDLDYVVDTTGSCFSLACNLVRPGGKVVVFGMSPKASEQINPFLIAKKNMTIYGVNMDSRTFPQAISLIKKIRSDKIITNKFKLEEYAAAFAACGLNTLSRKSCAQKSMKVLLCLG